MSNPEEASARGNWSDPEFLEHVADLNPRARHTQFADFHGHGWVFRAVFKKDRAGNLLDYKGDVVADVEHGEADGSHGAGRRSSNGRTASVAKASPCIFSTSTWNAACTAPTATSARTATATPSSMARSAPPSKSPARIATDRPTERAELVTSGPASPPGGHDLAALRTPFGKPRFEKRFERGRERIYQNSVVEPDLSWEVVQTADTIDPDERPLQRPLAHGEDGRIRPRRQAHLGRQAGRMPAGPSARADELHRLP